MEVVQIKNPNALMIPEVGDLLQKALTITQRVPPERMEAVAPDIIRMVADPNSFLFLGEEGGHFRLLILGNLPTSALFPHAIILSFYNEGSRALKVLGTQKVLDLMSSRGYNTAWAVNGTGKPDRAWVRAFQHPGIAKVTPMGTVFELTAQ